MKKRSTLNPTIDDNPRAKRARSNAVVECDFKPITSDNFASQSSLLDKVENHRYIDSDSIIDLDNDITFKDTLPVRSESTTTGRTSTESMSSKTSILTAQNLANFSSPAFSLRNDSSRPILDSDTDSEESVFGQFCGFDDEHEQMDTCLMPSIHSAPPVQSNAMSISRSNSYPSLKRSIPCESFELSALLNALPDTETASSKPSS